VDADSCPRPVRETVIRRAKKTGIQTIFVANRPIPGVEDGAIVQAVLAPQTPGAADDYIVAHAQQGDVAITRDVPLAARLLEGAVHVIDDRGVAFSPNSIRERLSLRDFALDLDAAGLAAERIPSWGQKELKKFADGFDRIVTAVLKAESGGNDQVKSTQNRS